MSKPFLAFSAFFVGSIMAYLIITGHAGASSLVYLGGGGF